jgi:hypothetical protein
MIKMPEKLRRRFNRTHEEKCEDLDHEIEIEEKKLRLRKLANKNKGRKGKSWAQSYQPNQKALDRLFGG